MDLVIKSIGIVVVVVAVGFMVRPELLRGTLEFVKQGYRFYLAAIVRMIVGIVFFVGATSCKSFWVIVAIGVILLISGIVAFVVGQPRFVTLINRLLRQRPLVLRVVAILPLTLGLATIFSA